MLFAFVMNSQDYSSYTAFTQNQKFVQLPEGKMAYIDVGTGPVIVLVHGIPTSAWVYRKMIPQLVDHGFRVVAPDMLGFGQSDKPEEYDLYHYTAHGERLKDFMEELGIDQWSQVCHDAGGMWSMGMLEAGATGVEHLIILNSVLLQEGFDPPMTFKPGLKARFMLSNYKGPLNKMVVGSTLKSGLKDKSVINKEMKEGYSRPFRKASVCGLYHFFTQTHKPLPDFKETLGSIDAPICVIWGSDDPFLLWSPMADTFTQITNVAQEDIHILDAAHFIQEEKPKEISDIISHFVKQ